MNSVEASRVLSVLDETLEALRLISYVSQDVLDTAEQLRDMLGEDLAHALIKHRQLMHSTKASLNSDQLQASTLELMRLLKKSPSATRMQVLPYERTFALLQVLDYFGKLRIFAQKRLTTTVEEDSSNREYYEEVSEREERAVSDRTQLEQKLRLQRVELQKASSIVQASEDRARAELHDVQASTQSAVASISSQSQGQAGSQEAGFKADHERLSRDLAAKRTELERLRAEHRDTEALLRKGRKRAQQDVEVQISEYDTDVGAKEDELGKARAEYDEVVRQLQDYNRGWLEMYQERIDFEEMERQIAEKKLQEALALWHQNRAARILQAAFRANMKAKVAARKKAKKAEAAKKGAKKK